MRGTILTVVASLVLTIPAQAGCVGFEKPVDGPVVTSFAPTGRYSGHWGIDIATVEGSDVRSAEPGVVTFSGSVAGNESITIDHGGGLKTSYSYLSERLVVKGTRVGSGAIVGTTGLGHELEALHFSVRIDGMYRNPEHFLGCLELVPADGLRLVS
jgi:murein DD-endopeptidase MepM/ murein hydrolase activator NlpD